jgi:hypothetical protein
MDPAHQQAAIDSRCGSSSDSSVGISLTAADTTSADRMADMKQKQVGKGRESCFDLLGRRGQCPTLCDEVALEPKDADCLDWFWYQFGSSSVERNGKHAVLFDSRLHREVKIVKELAYSCERFICPCVFDAKSGHVLFVMIGEPWSRASKITFVDVLV